MTATSDGTWRSSLVAHVKIAPTTPKKQPLRLHAIGMRSVDPLENRVAMTGGKDESDVKNLGAAIAIASAC